MVHAGVEKYCVILLYLTVQYQYIYKKSYFVWVIYFEFVNNISIFFFLLYLHIDTLFVSTCMLVFIFHSLSSVFLTTHLITPGAHQSLNPY